MVASRLSSSKEVKVTEAQPDEEKKRPKEFYLDTLQKLAEAYKRFSDNAWETQR